MATILVVDDQPEIRQLFQTALSRDGHKVVLARNGAEGLLAIEMCRPELILLDLAMPEMDGVSFLQVLRASEEWARVPVIMLTAFATDEQVGRAKKWGVSDHLVKARFSLRELRSRVAAVFAEETSAMAAV